MKKMLFLLMFLGIAAAAAASGDMPKGWLTSLSEAKTMASENNKPILILISGPEWCGPCRVLHKNVIDNKDFNRIVHKFAVCVFLHQPRKTDPSSQTAKDIAACRELFKTGGVPRYVITDPQLKELGTPKARTVSSFLQSVQEANTKMGNQKTAALKKVIDKYEKADKRGLKKALKKNKKK